MRLSNAALISLCVLGCGATSVAEAQEYGVLTGAVTPGVGAGARRLGAASASAVGRAANAVAAVNQATGASAPSGQPSGGPRSGPQRIDVQRFAALPIGDPLQGTDAPTYALAGGRTLRASGIFVPDAQPFAGNRWCQLEYSRVASTGGFDPSGPPSDDCRNVRR